MEINVGMMIDDMKEFVLNYYVNIDTISMMLLNKHLLTENSNTLDKSG